ncbi:SigE family RNA polymerase sigma factor [Catellatospora sp. KI3]|uniref:SigE family RNA polymerase sigma factor n=1 Tax=Catellatospora sp. KI3 TaxID=3041620 RepID=UPI002482F712|nr:SigE family RNA polymerase sigma factor [Catellatospora sp. KI3]MDI1465980.1 SigE family RNA polymerase sigma factor [Catellatospora sp. KI3]
MTGTVEFDEFVTARSRHLLRIAYVLTGDHALAEDLLQTALARSWSAWSRVHGDPEPYVRQILTNTYRSWWRRRWHGERATETLPEHPGPSPQAAVDERDQVWRALSRLPRQQKLVLVLRYFEDLSEADIARTLGISTGSVKAHASRALTTLRLDPSLRTLPLPSDDDIPAGNERLAAVRGRITQRRRNRLATLAAACLVVLAAVTGYVVAPRPPRSPQDLQDTLSAVPEYFRGHHIAARGAAPLTGGTATFTWTPSTLDVWFYPDCAAESAPDVVLVLSVNGRQPLMTHCDPDNSLDFASTTATRVEPEDMTATWGVRVGEPATVTLTAVTAKDFDITNPYRDIADVADLPRGVMAFLVAEAVPFEQYRLPDRPATLAPLPSLSPDPDAVTLRSGGPVEVTTDWHGGPLTLTGRSQTPGLLRISVNGVPVTTQSWYDYGAASTQFVITDLADDHWRRLGLVFPSGSAVTVTVTPEHVSGDWTLRIQQ